MAKKSIFSIASIVIIIISLELSLGITLSSNHLQQLKNVTQPSKKQSKGSLSNVDFKGYEHQVIKNFTNINRQPKTPHPYFGHVYNRSKDKRINKDGFSDPKDFNSINKNDPTKYYIGVFGGSVAKGFALSQIRKKKHKEWGFIDQLKSGAPLFFDNKDIVILNFGVSSYKQPQQFIVSSFYSNKIHMAITIDGYNEISSPYGYVFNANFPSYSNLFYSLDPDRNKYLGSLYELIDHKIKIALLLSNHNVLKQSHLIGSLWRIYDNWLQRRINYLHTSFYALSDKAYPYYEKNKQKNNDQKALDLASIWKNFTKKQKLHLSNEKILNFNFIQPNQHVENSKVLSQQEANYFYDYKKAPWINLGYKKILQERLYLEETGLNIYDLTKIFSNTRETVYRDSCCHLNKKGKDILATSIATIIIDKISIKKQ